MEQIPNNAKFITVLCFLFAKPQQALHYYCQIIPSQLIELNNSCYRFPHYLKAEHSHKLKWWKVKSNYLRTHLPNECTSQDKDRCL